MKPGKGRPYKKDITYCEPGKRLYKVPHTKKRTSGIEDIINTPRPKHPFTNG